jgi:hypothetical protein
MDPFDRLLARMSDNAVTLVLVLAVVAVLALCGAL